MTMRVISDVLRYKAGVKPPLLFVFENIAYLAEKLLFL